MVRLALLLLLLPGGRALAPTAGAVCRGHGSRLAGRLSSIEAPVVAIASHAARPLTLPATLIRSAYKTFVDTYLRAFHGATILLDQSRRSQFETEAEHWVSSMSTAAPAPSAGPQPTSNLSSTSNASSGSNASGVVAALSGALRSCLGLLHEALMAKVDARPPSFVSMPPANVAWNGVVLLSGGDRNAALADRVVANHHAFAQRCGYAYWYHRGSMVSHLGWQPYWHKIAMLRRAVSRFPSARAYVWVDDDIVLTNWAGEDMFEAALHRSNASVLATRDPASWVSLNTGIVIVRNDVAGLEALEEVWRRAAAPRGDGLSLAFDSQEHCLHEQQALQEMLDEPRWRRSIAVLTQRAEEAFNLNTFLRWSHYNAERQANLQFENDAHGSGWVRGDFAGHCSGLSSVRRALCVAVLLGAVVTAA